MSKKAYRTPLFPDIRSLRIAVLEARFAQGDAQRALLLQEATLRCTLNDEKGGSKNVGSNEQEREDRFRLYFVEDGEYQVCRRVLREAERALALAEAELESAYFALRSREADRSAFGVDWGERPAWVIGGDKVG